MDVRDTNAMQEYAAEIDAAGTELREAVTDIEAIRAQERECGDPLYTIRNEEVRQRRESAMTKLQRAVEKLGDSQRGRRASLLAAAQMLEDEAKGRPTL